ncbi:ubiquitin-like-specific protease 1 [Myzus persicae]|uniref:ubiquitin-like-specific protease 1 n=1 Tax=Myzus persicae TaxID=13164 RepID=UPI000B935D76|nr:ubiquitin-like-specific protease 1 [Myzus persicae]
MNRFEPEIVIINSMADLNELMDVTEDTDRYYFGRNEEENENPFPLVNDETADSNNILSVDHSNMDLMFSSIVDDINNIYKDYPSNFESLMEIDYVDFDNLDDSTSQNQPSTSMVVNGEQNYNIDAFTIVDSDDENKQEVRTENINDGEQDIINLISDDEDENSVQLNGEQNDPIVLSDTEDDDTSLETSQAVETIQLTSVHEIRSPKNIKKILPRFKTKVQETLHFLSSKRVDLLVRHTDGYKLLTSDLFKLITPRAWLTDGVIMHYFLLLVQHSKRVLLMDPDMLTSCTRKGFVPEKINKTDEYDKIIIPINPNRNHWAFVVLEIRQRKLIVIDSIDHTGSKELDLVNEFVDLAFKEIFPTGFENVKLFSPKQSNTDDCGVFTCTNARYYLFNRHPDYTQKDIPLLRHRIAWEIIQNTLIPF